MSKPSQHQHFRNLRASELERFAKIMELYIDGFQSGQVMKAVNQLRKENPNDTWGYKIEGLTIPLEKGRNVKPKDIHSLEMTIDARLTAQCKWNTFDDPFTELNFRVILKGIGSKPYFFGFRVERHNGSDSSHEPHPLYHLQFNANPLDSGDFDYGSVMSLTAPRITHYPMDIILGVSFALANFSPKVYENLCNDGTFSNLVKEYQESLWKPYLHTFASHWKPFNERNVTINPTIICPYLV